MSDPRPDREFVPLAIAVLTVSDTRTEENDRSGALLVDRLRSAGHRLAAKEIVRDDRYQVRAVVARWIAAPDIDVVLVTGGTGFSARDVTPEAVAVLLEQHIDGFGELFRSLSHGEIGASTIQSRALAGLTNHTLVFCVPGSTNACQTAWDGILPEQLDSRNRPCNFVQIIRPRR